MSASDRGKMIWKLADLIEGHIDEIAELETLDNGKPIFESRQVDMPMVDRRPALLTPDWATKIHGETVNTFEKAFTYTLREPIGVVGVIIPWNFPLLLASWKLGPALACGNTVVLKPAEQTPLTTLRLGELAVEAGFPAGVVNIVTGGPETGKAIVEHPGINKIAFTGSTAVGKEIMRAPPTRSNASLSNLAANLPTSFSPMRTSTRRSRCDQRHFLREGRGLQRGLSSLRRKEAARRISR